MISTITFIAFIVSSGPTNTTDMIKVPDLIIIKNQPTHYNFRGSGKYRTAIPDYSFNRQISNVLVDTGCASWHGATRTDFDSYLFYEIGNRGEMSVGKSIVDPNNKEGKALIYNNNDAVLNVEDNHLCSAILNANLLTFESVRKNEEERLQREKHNNEKFNMFINNFKETLCVFGVFFIPYYSYLYNPHNNN